MINSLQAGGVLDDATVRAAILLACSVWKEKAGDFTFKTVEAFHVARVAELEDFRKGGDRTKFEMVQKAGEIWLEAMRRCGCPIGFEANFKVWSGIGDMNSAQAELNHGGDAGREGRKTKIADAESMLALGNLSKNEAKRLKNKLNKPKTGLRVTLQDLEDRAAGKKLKMLSETETETGQGPWVTWLLPWVTCCRKKLKNKRNKLQDLEDRAAGKKLKILSETETETGQGPWVTWLLISANFKYMNDTYGADPSRIKSCGDDQVFINALKATLLDKDHYACLKKVHEFRGKYAHELPKEQGEKILEDGINDLEDFLENVAGVKLDRATKKKFKDLKKGKLEGLSDEEREKFKGNLVAMLDEMEALKKRAEEAENAKEEAEKKAVVEKARRKEAEKAKEEAEEAKKKAEQKAVTDAAISKLHPLASFNRKYVAKKRGKREGSFRPGTYRYTGRAWLFKDVRNWLGAKEGARTMLLLADAGFGKSAFAAQLVDGDRDDTKNYVSMKDRVVAYHFCAGERHESLDQDVFVKGLVVSLAKITDFKDELMKIVEEELGPEEEGLSKKLFDENSLVAFNKVAEKKNAQGRLQDYVLPALKAMEAPADGENRLLVVDSLDEATLADDKDNILHRVKEMAKSKTWPKWLKLLVTSRDQANVTSALNRAEKIDLQAVLKKNEEANNEDIRAYVKERMTHEVDPPKKYQSALGEVNANKWADNRVLQSYVEAVVDKSKGMFLYAVYTFDDIENKRLSIGEDVESFKVHLPDGIAGYYEDRFEKMQFGPEGAKRKEFREDVGPVLQVVAAAYEPPPLSVVAKALGKDPGSVEDVLRAISTFLKVEVRDGEKHYTFMHQSFTDWITNRSENNNIFAVSKEDGHKAIASAFVDHAKARVGEEQEIEGYWKTYGVSHVAEHVESWKRLGEVVSPNNVNKANINGVTALLALIVAAQKDHLQAVQALTDAKADVDRVPS
ncbi:hypothetical protein TeGR_g10986 [Tetraparma gracilis]|uniref:NACHT domain-containing protein n=1 Tax=Tetraparma gracilis TaxID=2962635 RepID=A0ABQ6MDP2_9STRA|nr:hypothetical protein TeGR_g10986 [Tetraparma gracilis]